MVSPHLFQREMSYVTPGLNKIDKSIRVNSVKNIATQLVEFTIKNGGRVPHGEVNKHLNDEKCSIFRNIINRAIQNLVVLPSLVI